MADQSENRYSATLDRLGRDADTLIHQFEDYFNKRVGQNASTEEIDDFINILDASLDLAHSSVSPRECINECKQAKDAALRECMELHSNQAIRCVSDAFKEFRLCLQACRHELDRINDA